MAERAQRQADRCDDDFRRSARVHAGGQREAFARGEAAKLAAEETAGELAEAGDEDQRDGHQRDIGLGQDRKIRVQAGNAEKDRREKCRDQPAQLLVDMPGQDRGFADEDAGDEGAEHRVYAERVGDQRHRPHDQNDGGDDQQTR